MPDGSAARKQEAKKFDASSTTSGKQLKNLLDRIDKLEEEKQALASDIRDVFAEAKMNGFDVKTMRKVLKLRRLADHERQEQDELLELYKAAIGLD